MTDISTPDDNLHIPPFRFAEVEREHLLAEAERARLEEVFRLAPSFMAVLRGSDHVFERANARYYDLVGGRELIGKTVREALPEVADQGFFEILDQVYSTGEPYVATDAQVLLHGPQGVEEHVVEFVYQPLRGTDGEVSGVIVQGIDLTQKKRAEAGLSHIRLESERLRRLYEAALSSTPDLVYVFDLDHRFTYANEALLRMWGKSWDEAIGKTCLELGYAPWHALKHDEEIEQVVATRASVRGEVPFTGTNGRRIYDYIFVPVIGADGNVEAVAGTTRDITERQAMEQELREAGRKKDEFLALLAHELRNPLAPIRNGLQVLRLAGNDSSMVAETRSMMERQLSHMVRLIDDLLDISRVSRNKIELRRTSIPLNVVIGNAIETTQPLIDEAGHELLVSLPSSPIHLHADLTRLAQVFSNLLVNSTKYTPPGGRIWLSAERRQDHVEVSVRDTGIGIPPEALENVFDMFSQVDRSIERNSGGLGIGLALVKGLVEMHGGTVTAESEGEGKGCTFIVTLPMLASSPGSSEQGAENTQLPSRRILVVDDNRDGANSLAMALRLKGNEVATAHDGLDSIEAAVSFRPDVILMDIGMPKMNGLEATRHIRAHPWGKTMTIIAVTGWGQEGDRERSRAAGCDGHLVKPVNLSELEKVVSEIHCIQ